MSIAMQTSIRQRSQLARRFYALASLVLLVACQDVPSAPRGVARLLPRALGDASARAAPVQDPASGHYYQRIDVPLTWSDANSFAQSQTYQGMPGHLVSIGSQAENDFVFSLFLNEPGGYKWIGGWQPSGSPEPAGGWQWSSREPWIYSNWNSGEPNNYGGTENSLAMYAGAPYLVLPEGGKWNDLPNDGGVSIGGSLPLSFVVEYDPLCPASVLNVGLPAFRRVGARLAYRSRALGIDFRRTVTNGEPGATCKYVSNSGALQVSLAPSTLPLLWVDGRSITRATVTLFANGQALAPVPSWTDMSIVNNGRLVNGVFDATHAYMRWESPGFLVELRYISAPFRLEYEFPLGGVVYWVDLTNLSQSGTPAAAEDAVRAAEAYLHLELSKRVVFRAIDYLTFCTSLCSLP